MIASRIEPRRGRSGSACSRLLEPADALVVLREVDQLEVVGEGPDQDPQVGGVGIVDHRFEADAGVGIARRAGPWRASGPPLPARTHPGRPATGSRRPAIPPAGRHRRKASDRTSLHLFASLPWPYRLRFSPDTRLPVAHHHGTLPQAPAFTLTNGQGAGISGTAVPPFVQNAKKCEWNTSQVAQTTTDPTRKTVQVGTHSAASDRWGRFVCRHRLAMIVAPLLLVLISLPLVTTVEDRLSSGGWLPADAESVAGRSPARRRVRPPPDRPLHPVLRSHRRAQRHRHCFPSRGRAHTRPAARRSCVTAIYTWSTATTRLSNHS